MIIKKGDNETSKINIKICLHLQIALTLIISRNIIVAFKSNSPNNIVSLATYLKLFHNYVILLQVSLDSIHRAESSLRYSPEGERLDLEKDDKITIYATRLFDCSGKGCKLFATSEGCIGFVINPDLEEPVLKVRSNLLFTHFFYNFELYTAMATINANWAVCIFSSFSAFFGFKCHFCLG